MRAARIVDDVVVVVNVGFVVVDVFVNAFGRSLASGPASFPRDASSDGFEVGKEAPGAEAAAMREGRGRGRGGGEEQLLRANADVVVDGRCIDSSVKKKADEE